MAISFIGSASSSSSPNADTTITLPAMVQNDLVIVGAAFGDNDNAAATIVMVTAGYTALTQISNTADTQDVYLRVFWKLMGATPDTTAVIEGNIGLGTDASLAGVAMVFRGIDTVTPIDVTPTTASGIDTMHPNPPSIDFLDAAAWTVIVGASGHTLAETGTYTFPTGYTTNAVNKGHNDTNDVTVGIGYKTTPADPEDPGVMTHSGADNVAFAWAAMTIALRSLPLTFSQTLSSSAITLSTLTLVSTFFRTLASTAVTVSALAMLKNFYRTLSVVVVGVSTLARFVSYLKTLSSTAVTVSALIYGKIFQKTLSAISGTASALSRTIIYNRTLAVTAVTVASLAKVAKYFITLAISGISVVALFTKGISLTLKNAANALVTSTLVKWGIFEYGSGTPSDANWMSRSNKGTDFTDASGILKIPYSGATTKGGTVYVAVVQPDTSPTESMAWTDTVI